MIFFKVGDIIYTYINCQRGKLIENGETEILAAQTGERPGIGESVQTLRPTGYAGIVLQSGN